MNNLFRITGNKINYRKIADGKELAEFSIYYKDNYKKEKINGEDKPYYHFFDAIVWGKMATVLNNYSDKIDQICVNEFNLVQERWSDKDGQKRSKTKIVIRDLSIVWKNKEQDNRQQNNNVQNNNQTIPENPFNDDDIPF